MNVYLQILLITALTGVGGPALGGVLAVLAHGPSDKQMSLLLRFTAGIMISVACFDLMTDAREEMGMAMVTVWVAMGFLATFLLNCWIDKRAHHAHAYRHNHHSDGLQEHEVERCACGSHALYAAGLVLAAAVALHHMPVGMAVGASFAAAGNGGTRAGVIAALVIGLHNLPEGMSITAPMLSGGVHPARAVLLAAASGIPTILGALIGYQAGALSGTLLGVSLSFAAGAMLYVVLGELLPEAEQFWRHRMAGFATLAGILLALALIADGHIHVH